MGGMGGEGSTGILNYIYIQRGSACMFRKPSSRGTECQYRSRKIRNKAVGERIGLDKATISSSGPH